MPPTPCPTIDEYLGLVRKFEYKMTLGSPIVHEFTRVCALEGLMYIYTHIHIYTFTCHGADQGHDANYSSIVGSGVGGMPRTRYTCEAAKRPSIYIYIYIYIYIWAHGVRAPLRNREGGNDLIINAYQFLKKLKLGGVMRWGRCFD